MSEFEKYTSKIIFFEPSPVIVKSAFTKPGDVARRLKFKHSLSAVDELALPRKAVEQSLGTAWTRFQAGLADCKKCEIVPTLDLFCDKTKCPIIDPSGLSRYCDVDHLSVVGTNRMLSSFKNVLKDIL